MRATTFISDTKRPATSTLYVNLAGRWSLKCMTTPRCACAASRCPAAISGNCSAMAVSAGRGYGSKYTVPTINLARYEELVPKDGVYISRTRVGDECFDSVTNIGNRPTFGA